MNKYRTIFVGRLLQESALSIGGSEMSGVVDSPCCVDGLGRPTLRGTTLAGALISTARKIFHNIPKNVTGDRPEKELSDEADLSVWRFFNAHPVIPSQLNSEYRQGVGIRQDTGASSSGILFDVEVFPRGTPWTFCLEVDTSVQNGSEVEAIAAAALMEWVAGRCWIGRSVARGLGWMKLTDLKALILSVHEVEIWPDSNKNPMDLINELQSANVKLIESDRFSEHFELAHLQKRPWSYLEIEGEIRVGLDEHGYGVDAISVSGHASNQAFAQWNDHYLSPKGINSEAARRDFNPDCHIVMSRRIDSNQQVEPFIPGSSIRGSLRHELSRILRRKGKTIRDPNVGHGQDAQDYTDEVQQVFGSMKKSARLLVRDAYLSDDKPNWTACWLQNHAEDEFSGGVFASSKFDRVALIDACLTWKMTIEAETMEQCLSDWEILRMVIKEGEDGCLPIGGAQWRGLGWPKWTWKIATLTQAGSLNPAETFRNETEVIL